jgi:hypothetical protein
MKKRLKNRLSEVETEKNIKVNHHGIGKWKEDAVFQLS